MITKKKKDKEIKLVYRYIEPKTPEERAEAKRRLARAYKIVFDQVLENRRKKEQGEGQG